MRVKSLDRLIESNRAIRYCAFENIRTTELPISLRKMVNNRDPWAFVSCPGPVGSPGQIADLVLQKAAIERVRQNDGGVTFLFSHLFDLFDLSDVFVLLFSLLE